MRAYRRLLTHRGVPRLLGAAVLSRLAAPILNLALLLAVVGKGGSYATGGLALTAFSVALAVSVPMSSRLADRVPLRRIMAVLLVGQVAAYTVVLLALSQHWPAGIVIAGAGGIGATTPPSTPVIRARWTRSVPNDQLRTAYALDTVINEAMVVSGTVLTSALIIIASPVLAVAVAGPATVCGVLVLLSTRTPPAAAVDQQQRSRRTLLGPLTSGPVRMVLGIAAFDMSASVACWSVSP